MAALRVALRLFLICGWTLLFLSTALPAALVAMLKRDKGGPTDLSGNTPLARIWATGIGKIIGLTIEVRGQIPRSPFFLVSNHLGYVDTILLMSLVPSVFISTTEVRSWPVIGFLAQLSGALFLNRDSPGHVRAINSQIKTALERGRGITLFPEGTSTRGDRILPFHSSLLEPALAGSRKISWACLTYETPPGEGPPGDVVCWWDKEQTFENHLFRLLSLPSFKGHVVFGAFHPCGLNRKEVARQLTEEVRKHFVPLT